MAVAVIIGAVICGTYVFGISLCMAAANGDRQIAEELEQLEAERTN